MIFRYVLFAILIGVQSVRAELLQLRFTWAPIFCFAGSANGVPKEFCGEGLDSIDRFQRHRQSMLKPFSKGCEPIPPYDPSALSAALRVHWGCTNPSYSTSTADEWYKRIWETGLGCAAQKLGMTQSEAFQYMTMLWDKYKPDAALAKSKINLWTKSKVSQKAYLGALKKVYGVDVFITCDGATGTRLSTVSLCIDTVTRKAAACPKTVIAQNRKRCPAKLMIERGNGSVKEVAKECKPYYK